MKHNHKMEYEMQVQREKTRAQEENPAPTKSKRFECPFDDCDASFKTRFYFCFNAIFILKKIKSSIL